jgi:hypothetical protein
MRNFEGILVALVMVGCSSSDPATVSQTVDGGIDAEAGQEAEAGHEAWKDAGLDSGLDSGLDVAPDHSPEAQADSPTDAPDSPQDAATEADAQTQVDAPEEVAAPGACSPPGPPGNVADCSSLCTTYCEPACPGGGLPGGAGTCNPYLTCDASDPIWSECLVVQGSQAGAVVRVLGTGNGPAWVYAQVDESWSGHPCPYSCP